MSAVSDRGKIDLALVEDGKYVLLILDDLEWGFDLRQRHAEILQNKINDYLGYVASGQAAEARPGLRPVIRVIGQHAFSRYALDFLGRVGYYVKNNGDICGVEWSHMPDEGPFDDGWSDDFVFDAAKVFPRLRKNFSKDPDTEIVLLSADGGDGFSAGNMPAARFLGSYAVLFVQDMGRTLTYLTNDMLPEGTDAESLLKSATENMSAIVYRWAETRERGVYGILAGGDFEAESLLFPEIWRQQAERLNDDLVICVPTRDMPMFAAASDLRAQRRMTRFAARIFDDNRAASPQLLFSRDLLRYTRADGELKLAPDTF